MQAMMQGRGQPYTVYAELSQTYTPQQIAADFTAIPKGIDVLMIAHPAALNDAQLMAIDQFALSGGRVLVFVDPNSGSRRPAPIPISRLPRHPSPTCRSSF